jgi:hypothetical protein
MRRDGTALKTRNMPICLQNLETLYWTKPISDISGATNAPFSQSITHDNVYRLRKKQSIQCHNGCAGVCRRCTKCRFARYSHTQNSKFGNRIRMITYKMEELYEHYQLAKLHIRRSHRKSLTSGGKFTACRSVQRPPLTDDFRPNKNGFRWRPTSPATSNGQY